MGLFVCLIGFGMGFLSLLYSNEAVQSLEECTRKVVNPSIKDKKDWIFSSIGNIGIVLLIVAVITAIVLAVIRFFANSKCMQSATTETTGGIHVGGNIQIDGYYDDWEGRPKTEITYSSNNKQCNHYGQLALDGDTLYGHFKMNELYTSGMQLQIWYLTINGKTFAMQIQPEKNGNIDWSTQVPRSEGIHTNLKAFIGYGNNNECDSKVAYTVYDAEHKDNTPGDEVEFSLSLKRLAELTGIPADEMGTITIQNPNIGGQGVSIAGSSTGPVVGVLIALLLAAGYVAKKRKGKR